jgi:hypothetical protein
MKTPEKCDQPIKAIFEAWRSRPRKELVEEGRVYLVATNEILANGYYKLLRTENRALAPGKARNKTAEDTEAGIAKYRTIRESIREDGFDPLRPLTFLVRKNWEKIVLHQGHHRLAAAAELGVVEVPVLFLYDREH